MLSTFVFGISKINDEVNVKKHNDYIKHNFRTTTATFAPINVTQQPFCQTYCNDKGARLQINYPNCENIVLQDQYCRNNQNQLCVKNCENGTLLETTMFYDMHKKQINTFCFQTTRCEIQFKVNYEAAVTVFYDQKNPFNDVFFTPPNYKTRDAGLHTAIIWLTVSTLALTILSIWACFGWMLEPESTPSISPGT